MYHGSSFAGDVNPWTAHQRRPWQGRGFLVVGAAVLPLNVVTPVVTFTTDELAVRLARIVMADGWAGSPAMQLFIRSRGAVLEDYFQQWTHDAENGVLTQRLDVLCPPFSQIELSGLSQTDTGNDRPVSWWVTGWLEPWPGSRTAPNLWKGV